MFGTSLSEIALVGVVALVVVGPQKLPTMLRTMGQWTGRLRRMTIEMRAKTGIDDILREEGIDGVAELRSLLRGEIAAAKTAIQRPHHDPYQDDAPVDLAIEYPSEGVDTMGAIPEDLIVHARSAAAAAAAAAASAATTAESTAATASAPEPKADEASPPAPDASSPTAKPRTP